MPCTGWTCMDGVAALAAGALVSVSPGGHDPRRAVSSTVECAVDVVDGAGSEVPVGMETISRGGTARIRLNPPFQVTIEYGRDGAPLLHIAIVDVNDARGPLATFVGAVATKPFIAIEHLGEIGDGIRTTVFDEVIVECRPTAG